ncbi:hypothetical protein ACFSKU_21760 [Pontibacter silvestris]|uniref:DUF4148 domain-containing protein n=1 Tax=Pontibacter silvestris TaxID=2305183 RepID=A0ABW4X5Z8_9BACT
MKRTIATVTFAFLGFMAQAQINFPSMEAQIKSAELAAPSKKREAATIYGYSPKG